MVHVFLPKARADEMARLIATREASNATLDYKGIPSTNEGTEARRGMETRKAEATNNLRAVVAEVVRGAKVLQGGGTERFEDQLQQKVRAAAVASLDRLFPEFHEADDANWHTVIGRARAGAEHPLQMLDFQGKTEEHPVCAAVLAFIGPGKRGKEVRSHFDSPPYGWPRDAVDGALISLFATGHLRATTNGEPVRPGQLDQSKVSNTDFRVESATVGARQRIALRGLFKSAGVDCRSNEEATAAGDFLAKLQDLASQAGGDAPRPVAPATAHLDQLKSLAGNERLLAILAQHDELKSNVADWSAARSLTEERQPRFQHLTALAKHAEGLDVAAEALPQIKAIAENRSLLSPTDPVPPLTSRLSDALRSALTAAESVHVRAFEEHMRRLHSAESWQQIEQPARDEILRRLHIEQASVGTAGTVDEVLASLDNISLDDWRTRTAALPELFATAKAEADKLVEPTIRHVKVGSPTLRTAEDVENWAEKTKADLLKEIEQGPIVVR